MSFRWVLMMKFSITFGFKNGLDFQFSAGFRLKYQCASLHSTYKIFQKKKKKKRKPVVQVEGFKKASFFEKILPDTSSEVRSWSRKWMLLRTVMGGDFFKNPCGLNLLFCKPGTYLCSLFFYFLFWFPMVILLFFKGHR